ncbi:MAG: hypothetical protein JWM59_234 [Verrucomicrobiales bacterium]|nr:hypothetical protein [Verrucomicrobiales bacterium]
MRRKLRKIRASFWDGNRVCLESFTAALGSSGVEQASRLSRRASCPVPLPWQLLSTLATSAGLILKEKTPLRRILFRAGGLLRRVPGHRHRAGRPAGQAGRLFHPESFPASPEIGCFGVDRSSFCTFMSPVSSMTLKSGFCGGKSGRTGRGEGRVGA